MSAYESVAITLAARISALMPTHPEIADMENVFDLFKVEGFDCDDLEPSLAQAAWALRKAQADAKGGAR